MAGEDADQIAARIAQKLRDAGFGCTILDPAPTETAFGTLLQRDRIIVALTLPLLTAVRARGHGNDWLPDNSVRHGADDAGTHAMAGDGVRIRICHVDRNDGRHDDVLSDANDSH